MTRRRLTVLAGALALTVGLAGCPGNGDLDCDKHPNEVSLPGDRCQHTSGSGFVNHPGPCAIGC
jgi:hypothetical protein